MAIRIVRLGTAKMRNEGLRLGTVRLLPRGVKKQDYARRNFFDVWLPEVSPSRGLVAYAQAKPWTDARWATYRRRYLAEMRRPEPRRMIRSEEHTSELQSQSKLECRLLLEEKKSNCRARYR